MDILWVVAPPHFAEHLRDIGATSSGSRGEASSGPPDRGAGGATDRHGYRDGRYYFLPRLAAVAAALAVAAAGVTLSSRERPGRAAAYALGATLATAATTFAVSPGPLPPVVLAAAALLTAVSTGAGALGGTGLRRLARRPKNAHPPQPLP
jgi:hypothetical protein